jgi:hypothetical protein
MVGTAQLRLCPPYVLRFVRNDEDTHPHSRGWIRPSFASHHPRKYGGRRECRMQAAPMARLQQGKQAAVTTGSAETTGIPRAMVLRLIRALAGVPGLLATVAL